MYGPAACAPRGGHTGVLPHVPGGGVVDVQGAGQPVQGVVRLLHQTHLGGQGGR